MSANCSGFTKTDDDGQRGRHASANDDVVSSCANCGHALLGVAHVGDRLAAPRHEGGVVSAQLIVHFLGGFSNRRAYE